MKTQIIQLSQSEDAISIREKISWSQAQRILLVYPAHGHTALGMLDLTLARRKAASLGSQLALVTSDAAASFYARELGMSVFASIKAAQEAEWSQYTPADHKAQNETQRVDLAKLAQGIHRKPSRWLEHPATKIACISLAVLALLILGICLLPGAKIIITPKVESQSMVFNLVVDPTATDINYSTGSLPAYYKAFTIEGSDTANATGSVIIPDKSAAGTVRFTNHSDQPIPISAGTIVTTSGRDPVRFITTNLDDASVAPDQSVDLGIQAVQPGPTGNLDAGELDVIEGGLTSGLEVTNPKATSGGSLASVPSPSLQDLSGLHQRLLSKLIEQAQAAIKSGLPEGDIMITPPVTRFEMISETSFPAVDEPGNVLEITLKIRVQSQVISRDTLQAFINPIMDAYTPQGYSPIRQSLAITQQGSPTSGEGEKLHLTVQATRQVQAHFPAEKTAGLVTGQTVAEAMQHLSAIIPFAGQPSILLSPSWWPRLPFLAMRIEVVERSGQ